MKIVVSGGSGFIGTPLVERLAKTADVVVLTRNPAHVRRGRGVEWHPPTLGAWGDEVASAEAVVNLAGENIGGGRWTESRKRALVSSRLDATNALVAAMQRAPGRTRTFISASAIGYYGVRGDETVDEHSQRGCGFLADLCEKWEAAARAADPIARLVILRFGVVLEKGGGALGKMLLPFRLGVGGPIGSGDQWMSWVEREDVIRVLEWAIGNAGARDVYNVSAPEPVRNRDFARELGRALHRPALIPTPGFALRLAFGEMADEALLGGQRVVPSRLQAEGFVFAEPALRDALQRILL
jgi:uncharacterized protein (TIGR01777 family)